MMKPELNLVESSGPRPLPETVELTSNVVIDWDVRPATIENRPVFQRNGSHQPIRVVLEQQLGTDRTLFELNERVAGFGIKATFSIMVGEESGVEKKDVLDVDFADLVPDEFCIDVARGVVVLSLISMTAPEFTFP